MTNPFNPLDVSNIGVTLAIELLQQPRNPLPPTEKFAGAGVYAIYYHGPFDLYAPLASANRKRLSFPIYIGSAVRKGAKMGFKSTPEKGCRLHDRLLHHAESINGVENIEITDFSCRHLVLDDAFILLAESVLIGIFQPIWNGMGFGSKVVGINRMGGQPSPWDTLHPGRIGRPAATQEKEIALREKVSAQLSRTKMRPTGDEGFARMFDRIVRFL